ncbi:MAG: tetratricopeptide repeat protein [Polyangiaceae bacterium]
MVARTRADHEQTTGMRVPPSNVPSSPVPVAPVAPDAVGVLFQQADTALRARASVKAASLLQRILTEYPSDARGTLAQFTLGRIYLDSLGEPALAVAYFNRAIEGGVPGALAEDAHARLVDALARAGNRDGAASAATRYRALYPNGRHLQDVNRCAPPVSAQ